jgi:hypothetical protein
VANSIQLAEKYTALLDSAHKKVSLTGVLEMPNDMVREVSGAANTVLLPEMTLQGLGDYDRNTGYVAGDATLTYTPYTLSEDRGRKFQVDNMDNLETVGVAFGRLAGEFIKQHVTPELDAYRFAELSAKAGATVAVPTDLTAGTVTAAIDVATETLDNAEVPDEGRWLFVTPEVYTYLKNSDKWERKVEIKDRGGIDRRIDMFDGMPVIKVPQSRFYTSIDLYDGTTGGQENGGYIKTAVTGKDINFMMVHQSAAVPVTKLAKVRIFEPAVNQDADAYRFDYRLYHDIFVPTNKADGIYVHHKA